MKDYIERASVHSIIEQTSAIAFTRGGMHEKIDSLPAADVAEVRHGRWVKRQNPQWKAYYHDACSICGWWNTKNSMCYNGMKKPGHSLNYCPNCGALMDVKEDEHEAG